jgi:hypothetical protein
MALTDLTLAVVNFTAGAQYRSSIGGKAATAFVELLSGAGFYIEAGQLVSDRFPKGPSTVLLRQRNPLTAEIKDTAIDLMGVAGDGLGAISPPDIPATITAAGSVTIPLPAGAASLRLGSNPNGAWSITGGNVLNWSSAAVGTAERPSVVADATIAATSISRELVLPRGAASLGGGGVGPIGPTILPTAAISDDSALLYGTNNVTQYITLPDIGVPASDWSISIPIYNTITNSLTMPFLSVGVAGNAMLSALGNMHLIGAFGAGQSLPLFNIVAATMRDDAGVWGGSATRVTLGSYYGGASTAVRGLEGPWASTSTVEAVARGAGSVRWYHWIRRGIWIELWYVDPGKTPYRHARYKVPTLGAIAPKPARLGYLPIASPIYQKDGRIQRFMKVAKALTPAQMVAIAQGVDPRAVVDFSAADGDLLFAFKSGTLNQVDLIQGAVATLSASMSTGSGTTVPQAVVSDMPRVDNIHGYGQGVQAADMVATPGVGITKFSLPLFGTVTGADDDIWAQVVGFADSTNIIYPWQNLGRSANGEFKGKMIDLIPSFTNSLDVQIRKGLNGTVYTMKQRFRLGFALDIAGQSNGELLRTGGTYTPTGTGVSASSSLVMTQNGNYYKGFQTPFISGWGENMLKEKLTAALGVAICTAVSAVSGSAIESWNSKTAGNYENFIESIQKQRPFMFWWDQGEANTSTDPATYKSYLDALWANIKSDTEGFTPWFVMKPVGNTNLQAGQVDGRFAIYRAQREWANAKYAAGEKVIWGGDSNTKKLGDGLHGENSVDGMGRILDPMIETIKFLVGLVPNSGVGPQITSATWTGQFIDVTLTHNGGTALQTPNVAAITGFEASLDNFANNLSITDAQITGANKVRLTLSAAPASAPAIRYLYGLPGKTLNVDANGYMVAVGNALRDNRTPAVNPTLGFEVAPTLAPIQAVAA